MKTILIILALALLPIICQEKKNEAFEQIIKELADDKARVRKDALAKALALSDEDREVLAKTLSKSSDIELKLISKKIAPLFSIVATNAQKLADATQLKNIGIGILFYHDDHEGHLPKRLATLVKGRYLLVLKIFVSPGSKTKIPTSAKDIANGQTDYVYLASKANIVNYSSADVLAMTKPGIYKGFVNVLHGDLRVKGYKTDATTAEEVIAHLKKIGAVREAYQPIIIK